MPRSRARRQSGTPAAPNRSRTAFRPTPATLEGRIAPAHNITIALGGLATIPSGATTNADTGDYTISPDALAAVTGVENAALQANNDIRVNAPVVMQDGVGLVLLAGRSVVVTGDGTLDTIRTTNATIIINANFSTSGDGTDSNRDPGDGSLILNDAIVAALGSGRILLRGANGPDGPVVLLGRTVVRGESSLFGVGNNNTRPGIFIADTASIVDDAGRGISLSAFSAFSSAGFSTGITLLGKVRSNGGKILIGGTGRGSGPSGHGLLISGASARIENTGSGEISLIGKGGSGPGSFGVSLDGGGGSTPVPMVVSQDGPISINGTGIALATNFGVAIGERAQVRINGSGALGITTGTLSLNAVATPGSIFVADGNVTMRVSSLRLDDPGTIATSNGLTSTINILAGADTRPIVLGGPLSSDALVLNNATFAAFSGFKTIAVESGRAGDITMNGDVGPVGADLQISSLGTAGGFVLSKTLDIGANKLILTANGAIAQAPGGLIKGSGGALIVTAANVGTAAAPLLTQVGELGGATFRNGLFVSNAGKLRVGPTRTGQLGTNGGDLVLKNTGPIQIVDTPIRTAGGAIRINASITANTAGDALVLAGQEIDAQGGDIALIADSTLFPAMSLEEDSLVQTSGAGRITIAGRSTSAAGLGISGNTSIRSVDGTISITGETTALISPAVPGIDLDRATIEATGRGGISLRGLGGERAERSSGTVLRRGILRVKDGPLSLLGASRSAAPGLVIGSTTIQSTGSGSLEFVGVTTGNANAIAIDLDAPPQASSIVARAGAISFTGDSMGVRPPTRIQGNGPLLIQPLTPSRPISLGDSGSAGTLGFSADLLQALAPGFSQVTIGRADGTGRISTVRPLTFTSDVVIRSPGAGSAGVALSHSIDAGAHNLTIASAGPVALNAGTLSVVGKTLRIKGSTINAFAATLSAGDRGRIVFEGNTTLRPATTIAVVVSLAQATNLALIDVVGKINLNNANLRASGPGRIAAGTGFSLIRNDGNDAIPGRFAQGSSLTIAGQPYQLALNRGNNDALLKRQAAPINVKLVTKLVQNGRKKVKTTFIDANFVDGGQLKSETLSPLQPSRFKNIRITTADSDRDGTIDTVTVLGNVGKLVTTMTVSV